MSIDPLKHSTTAELEYLKRIGQFNTATAKLPRETMLRSYLVACDNRDFWDGMNRARIIEFAIKELAKETRS